VENKIAPPQSPASNTTRRGCARPNIRHASALMQMTNAAWSEGNAFSMPSPVAIQFIATLAPTSGGRGPCVGKN